jgi:hypothetical protein
LKPGGDNDDGDGDGAAAVGGRDEVGTEKGAAGLP